MTRLVVFDLDGTLLDTIEDLGMACNHALRMCGCPERRMEEYSTLVGRGIYNLFRGALPPETATEEMVMEMKRHFIPYYDRHKSDRTKPYPGIIPMLERLSQAGVRMAVASNKYQDGTEKLVREYFSGDSLGSNVRGRGRTARECGICGGFGCGHADRKERRRKDSRGHMGIPHQGRT